jgi:hypothetical protein
MDVMKSKYLWTASIIVAMIVLVAAFLPKPLDTNLEEIGNGQRSVVFIYDPNLVVSNQQANEMKRAREITGEKANFLVVRAGDPTRDDFKEQYQTRPVDLLFFNGIGELVDRRVALINAEALIEKVTDG